jgi:hypothetical protein
MCSRVWFRDLSHQIVNLQSHTKNPRPTKMVIRSTDQIKFATNSEARPSSSTMDSFNATDTLKQLQNLDPASKLELQKSWNKNLEKQNSSKVLSPRSASPNPMIDRGHC